MNISKLKASLRTLHAVHPEITVSQALTLLEIATDPGISVAELQDRTKAASQACVSVRIRRLSSRPSVRGALGLVDTAVDKNDERFKKVFLTDHGKRLIRRMEKA